jgi:elongation factor P
VMKAAVLETGKSINVPLCIKAGEKVKVSTTDGQYMGRA